MNQTFKGFYGLLIAGGLSLALMAGCGGGGGGGGGSSSTSDNNTGGGTTYSISGTVTDSSSVVISGVTVDLSGASTGSTTTDSSGNFTFSGLANGSYTVTPSKTDYTFSPASSDVTVNGADITGQNFVGSATGGGGSTAATGRMPDTNQTTSYTSTFGEDADYTINPPSYTDNGNGTITDNVTGLMWQKQDDGTTRTWADAGTYCDASTLGGYSDWRLPSQSELISLIDNGVYSPSINTTFFPDTISSYYWSSTTIAYSTSDAWSVYFGSGFSYSYGNKTDSNYVRCVRGGETTQSLTDNGNGTVTDNNTNLTWQQGENSAMTWETALSYCEGLSLAGDTDWRLPNHKELLSLVDSTRFSPAINTTLFPNAISSDYWSSTTRADITSFAWDVSFFFGYSDDNGKTLSYYGRCVRGSSVSDDTGSGTTYSISGKVADSSNVAMSGVTVALTGASTGSTTTDSSGNFTFTGLANGSYTVTPSKTGYTFNPSSTAVTVSSANVTGQNFVGSTTSTSSGPVSAIAAGGYHTIALKTDGTVWAWGSSGLLINGNDPAQVSGLANITAIAAGGDHSIVLKTDGTVWAWGDNDYGQLGDNTTTIRYTPVQVSGLTDVTAIAAGYSHSIALRTDGTVWAWGNNDSGRLGDGTTTTRYTPVQVSGLTNVTAIAAGGYHSIALKNDGTVWTWGYNSTGQLGDGTTTTRHTPVQVSGLTDVTAIAAGYSHSIALRTDGTVWAWGLNSYGQLGDDTTTNRYNPVQVSGLTGVTAIAAGGYHTIALKTDGTVWAWGQNSDGQLGDGTTATRYTPVEVSGF